ncbi:MAG: flagellar biosynthesis protein FlhB [Neisseriaceae bacterium]
MAEESGGEKTEQPTPKKLRDAREKGQVAQSKEMTSLSSAIILIAGIVMFSSHLFKGFFDSYAVGLSLINTNIGFSKIIGVAFEVLKSTMGFALVLIIIASFVSLLVNLIQIRGIVLNKEFLKFDMNRLNPVTNFKNIYGLKNFLKFIRIIFEATIITITLIVIIKGELSNMLKLYQYTISNILLYIVLLLAKILGAVFIIMVVFAIIDYILEARNLNKQLMMSLSEIKQEYKNTEGDPEVKQRRKELHRELLEDDVESGVANSTMVLANPTHLAIVLIYHPQQFKLPIVIIKAKGEQAQKIFGYARKHNVLIFRDVWLTRQLYALAEVGKFIPQSLFAHVADAIGKNLHVLPKLAQEIKMANMPKPETVKAMPITPAKTLSDTTIH